MQLNIHTGKNAVGGLKGFAGLMVQIIFLFVGIVENWANFNIRKSLAEKNAPVAQLDRATDF